MCSKSTPVADPGFLFGGGGGANLLWGPPTRVLFGENVCENERIGSHSGGGGGTGSAPGSANTVS